MRFIRFTKLSLLLALGLQTATLGLQAAAIDFSILNPDQTGTPGGSNLFEGTITNNSGADLSSTDLFLNFSGYDFTNVSLTQLLGGTVFTINNGDTSPLEDLFTFDLAGTAAVPDIYTAQVSLEDASGDISPTYTVSVSTVPEPRFLSFVVVVAFLLVFLVGRRREIISKRVPSVRTIANAANTSVRATRVAHAYLRAASPLLGMLVAGALIVQIPSSAQVSAVQFSTGKPGLAEIGTTLMVAVPLTNDGSVDATSVKVTAATLRSATLASPTLPVTIGTIGAGQSAVFQADFNAGSLAQNTSYLLTITGTYSGGGSTAGFSVNRFIVPPPPSSGSGIAGSISIAPLSVSTGGFTPQPLDFPDDANSSAPPIPTGPFSAVTPTGGTSVNNGNTISTANSVRDGAVNEFLKPRARVGFQLNQPLGLVSGGSNGQASGTAEPSGGASAGGLVFVTTNWTAAYSTNHGSSFQPQLDPTAVFPKDAVGYCCDQIVQYVPSIDRVIWLLQGNGYRLASASPAQIMSSNGKAWTYWNLTPSVFGPSGSGFDYPDMSVGDNYLYISWDTGCTPNCNGGRQIARVPLSEIQSSSTINIGYTHQSDSNVAWGCHLMQDTGNEIFWAGHNGNSTLRVFSWAEGSNTYFWRDIGIGSWANSTPIVSDTPNPNSENWVDFLFDPTKQNPGGGFPLFGVLGATRSGSQLWFAWSAGNDNNFPNPHVEMVTLDRSNNFNLIQQVQIWSSSEAFAYPALATNKCTGEIGLSLESGGDGNYENHVVGFWGDFLVFQTTNSNVGSTRYGDYVTIRQNFNPNLHGAYFDAFGYGLNSPPPGSSGTNTDVRYVVFGRPGACNPG